MRGLMDERRGNVEHGAVGFKIDRRRAPQGQGGNAAEGTRGIARLGTDRLDDQGADLRRQRRAGGFDEVEGEPDAKVEIVPILGFAGREDRRAFPGVEQAHKMRRFVAHRGDGKRIDLETRLDFGHHGHFAKKTAAFSGASGRERIDRFEIACEDPRRLAIGRDRAGQVVDVEFAETGGRPNGVAMVMDAIRQLTPHPAIQIGDFSVPARQEKLGRHLCPQII